MRLLLFLSIFFLFVTQMDAQKRRFNPKQRFHAGLFLGLNAAQISGDKFTGYDKLGMMAGLQGVALLNEHMDLSIELLYSQKGTKVEYTRVLTDQIGRVLEFNYAEVPVLVRFHVFKEGEDNKIPVNIETGFSFARLIQTNIKENAAWETPNFTAIANDFRRSEWNYILGGNVGIFPNTHLGLRTSVAFTKVYINETPIERNPLNLFDSEEPYRFFRNYHLTLYVSYQLY